VKRNPLNNPQPGDVISYIDRVRGKLGTACYRVTERRGGFVTWITEANELVPFESTHTLRFWQKYCPLVKAKIVYVATRDEIKKAKDKLKEKHVNRTDSETA
jgi:hypothetical protein